MQQPLAVHLAPAGGVAVTPITALDISATRIRQALGKRSTPRYLLPQAVLEYVHSQGLYTQVSDEIR
jgi:nicotinate-nucleotide adenylyltransferase